MANYDDTATVSGSVVSIENGADDVPTKSLVVTIPPTLSGVSSVTETQTGKNLLDVSTAQGTGTIWFYYDNGIKLKKGATYTFSCGNYGNGSIAFYGTDHSTQIAYAYISASSAKVTYTPTEDVIVCPRIYQSGLTVSGLVDVMLEVGSSASSYEPYIEPTTHTASLGRTIYGGSVDVVNGTGTDENGNDFTFDGQEVPTRLGYNAFWSEQGNTELTYYKDGYGFTSVTIHKETSDGEPVEQTAKLHRIVYEGEVDVVRGIGKVSIGESGTEYDPPETFTFPPISMETDEGENTLFTNEGDSAITYRKAVD